MGTGVVAGMSGASLAAAASPADTWVAVTLVVSLVAVSPGGVAPLRRTISVRTQHFSAPTQHFNNQIQHFWDHRNGVRSPGLQNFQHQVHTPTIQNLHPNTTGGHTTWTLPTHNGITHNGAFGGTTNFGRPGTHTPAVTTSGSTPRTA